MQPDFTGEPSSGSEACRAFVLCLCAECAAGLGGDKPASSSGQLSGVTVLCPPSWLPCLRICHDITFWFLELLCFHLRIKHIPSSFPSQIMRHFLFGIVASKPRNYPQFWEQEGLRNVQPVRVTGMRQQGREKLRRCEGCLLEALVPVVLLISAEAGT